MRSAIAPARLTLKDWFGFISPIVLVIGALIAAGSYIAQVRDNTRRIDKLEERDEQRVDKLNAIDMRTVRIEAKLEILVPPSKGAKQ